MEKNIRLTPNMDDETKILMLAYTVETLLAEKLETILTRGIANTRSRDFYDVYILYKTKADEIDYVILREALTATLKKRKSEQIFKEYRKIIEILLGTYIMKFIGLIIFKNCN